jgi:hypothetical protein
MTGAGSTRAATAITAVAVAVGIALLSTVPSDPRGAVLTAASGALLSVAALLWALDRRAATAAASALFPPGALLAAAGLALAARASGALGLVVAGTGTATDGRTQVTAFVATAGVSVAAWVAAFGAAGTLRDGIGDGAVKRLWRGAVLTTTVVAGSLGLVVGSRSDALAGLPAIDGAVTLLRTSVLAPTTPWVAAVTLFGTVAVACLTLRAALVTVPVVELASRRHRGRVRARVERVESALGTGFTVASTALVVGSVAASQSSALGALVLAVSPPPLRSTIVALVFLSGLVATVGRALQRVTGSTADVVGRTLPAAAGSLLLVAVASVAGVAVPWLLAALPESTRPVARNVLRVLSPPGLALAIAFLALVATTGVLGVIVLGGAVQYVPARNGGGAIAGAGLVLGALVVGATGGPPAVVFGVIALALVAWDVSERGVETRAELGSAGTTRTTVVHALGSATLAALGVTLAWLLLLSLASFSATDRTVVAALAVVTGSVVVLGVLRG